MRTIEIGTPVKFRVGNELFSGRISKQTSMLSCVNSYYVHTFFYTFLVGVEEIVF
jgi:hypothetical protein